MRREVPWSHRVLACAGTLLAGTVVALAAQEPEPYEARSPSMVRTLSFLGTAVPIAASFAFAEGVFPDAVGPLLVGGLVLGPILGYVYAGEVGRGMAQAGIRAVVLAGTVGAAVLICSGGGCDFYGSPGSEELLVGAVVAAGVVMTSFLAVRDIIQVGDRVRAPNQRLGVVSVRPTYFPESRTAGLLFTWRH